jgi:hypothetical protein
MNKPERILNRNVSDPTVVVTEVLHFAIIIDAQIMWCIRFGIYSMVVYMLCYYKYTRINKGRPLI